MITQSEVTENYSTLEVVIDDVTPNAPELDRALTASGLDGAAFAPQAMSHPGPEVAYYDCPPEALDDSKFPPEALDDSEYEKENHRLSKRYIFLILVCFMAAAIGLGVHFITKAKHSTSLGKHGILNDSSLAALNLPNGDRRLFYQGHTGQIKQAAYSSSSRDWPLTLTSTVASDARNYTPLAAVNLAGDADLKTHGVYLFYITTNDSLAVTRYDGGAWIRPNDQNGFRDGGISDFIAGKTSKSLSITEIPDDDLNRLFLIYENSDGFVTIKEGTSFRNEQGFFDWKWQDLTSKFQSSVPQIKSGSQFSSLYNDFGVQIFFYKYETNTQNVVTYHNGIFGYRDDTSRLNSMGIPNSETVLVNTQLQKEVPIHGIIFVNGSRLVCYPLSYTMIKDSPVSSFPNTKLAATSGNSATFYVYHQINDNTFGEDQADRSVGGWIQSSFTVPT